MTLLVTNVSSNDTVDGKPWLPARHVSCVHLAVERVSRTGKIVAFERANVHRDKRAMSLPVSPREKRRRRCLRPVDETRRKKKRSLHWFVAKSFRFDGIQLLLLAGM